jgi:hypothetical protein
MSRILRKSTPRIAERLDCFALLAMTLALP